MNSVPKVDFNKKPCNTKRKRFEIEVRKLIRFGSVNIRFKVGKKIEHYGSNRKWEHHKLFN